MDRTKRAARRLAAVALALIVVCLSMAAAWAEPENTPALPERYYLTNLGQVTTVKLQNPWGVCWAFACTAALESSLLKSMNPAAGLDDSGAIDETLFDQPKLTGLIDSVDLSELAISWFSLHPHGVGSQSQEGWVPVYTVDPDEDASLQLNGGYSEMVEALVTARQGAIAESDVPYQYRGYQPGGSPSVYSGKAMNEDWSVDESFLTAQALARVTHVTYLAPPAKLNAKTGRWLAYDPEATEQIKRTLVQTGAVAVSLQADLSTPGSAADDSYMNTTHWAQYNDASEPAIDHMATIVGWDDTYSRDNFRAPGNHLPPGDGAWLVKNSWGSSETPGISQVGLSGYGIDDSGFFWLSYYDHSLTEPISFSVDPASLQETALQHLYQYDYLAYAGNAVLIADGTDGKVANVFTAQSAERLTAVSVRAIGDNAEVAVQIYLLADGETDDRDPTNDRPPIYEQTFTVAQRGYHVLELDRAIDLPAGQRFAVVQRQSVSYSDPLFGITAETYIPVEIGDDFDYYLENGYLTLDENGVYRSNPEIGIIAMFLAVAGEGETFIFDGNGNPRDRGSHWMSTEEYRAVLQAYGMEDLTVGNAMIKAFTADADRAVGRPLLYGAWNENGGAFYKHEDAALRVTTAALDRMIGASLDGEPLPDDAWQVEDGVLLVAGDRLNLLSDGDHRLTLTMTDGEAALAFAIARRYRMGDVNGDGTVNVFDALLALQIAVDKWTPAQLESASADVDNDSHVTAADALTILKSTVGLVTIAP